MKIRVSRSGSRRLTMSAKPIPVRISRSGSHAQGPVKRRTLHTMWVRRKTARMMPVQTRKSLRKVSRSRTSMRGLISANSAGVRRGTVSPVALAARLRSASSFLSFARSVRGIRNRASAPVLGSAPSRSLSESKISLATNSRSAALWKTSSTGYSFSARSTSDKFRTGAAVAARRTFAE